MSSEDELVCEVKNGVGKILLNRPSKLNCLTMAMIRRMRKTLQTWDKKDSGVKVILVRGAGRAFCSGGDVVSLYHGDKKFQTAYLKEEYKLDMQIHLLTIPYITLLDGITMGGGCGISVNGKYRVATKRTVMAMPECSIGLVPDVGAGHFLSKLGGHMGIFLGLTGYRLEGRDCLSVGLCTHYFSSKEGWDKLDRLESELEKIGDVDVDSLLNCLFETKKSRLSISQQSDMIDAVFSLPTLEELVEGLEALGFQAGEEGQVPRFARDSLAKMKAVSPTSLRLTFQHLKDQELKLSLEESLSAEQRMQTRCLAAPDFREGVRTSLIEKEKGHKPSWNPKTIKQASIEHVSTYMRPLPPVQTLKEDDREDTKAWAAVLGMGVTEYILAKEGRVSGQLY